MTPREVLAGIRDGNYHAGGIRALRLRRLHEPVLAALRSEVAALCERERPSDVRDRDHVTNWTRPRGAVLQYSLFNSSGRCDDFSEDHDSSCVGKQFHLATDYPALARFIAGLPHTVNLRVNVLGPRARLAPHEEHSIIRMQGGAPGVRARFHLPLMTDAGAELTLDGQVFHLAAGIVHFVNHGCVHAARNDGSRPRVHLVWDMLLTQDAYDATFGDRVDDAIALRGADRELAPLRTERMGASLHLPQPVSRDDAETLALCQPQ